MLHYLKKKGVDKKRHWTTIHGLEYQRQWRSGWLERKRETGTCTRQNSHVWRNGWCKCSVKGREREMNDGFKEEIRFEFDLKAFVKQVKVIYWAIRIRRMWPVTGTGAVSVCTCQCEGLPFLIKIMRIKATVLSQSVILFSSSPATNAQIDPICCLVSGSIKVCLWKNRDIERLKSLWSVLQTSLTLIALL